MKGIVNLLLVLVLVLLGSIPLAGAVTIEITNPPDGDWCNNDGNELYISGLVQNIQENETISAFFKAEWDDSDGCWYPGIPIILVPLVEDGNWSCYISMESEDVTGPWINITAIVLDGGTSIESGKGYTEDEIQSFALASDQVICKRCTEPTLNIISPIEGKNVGYNNVNILVEGEHNLFDENVSIWLAGNTNTNSDVWGLGTVDKNPDGTFSEMASPGNCTVTCGATQINFWVFALRQSGVEIWLREQPMTEEEFEEFLETMSCVDDTVTILRPCTEPTPVPALSPIGMVALAGLLCLIGAGCVMMKRK